jgi:hypothetical protein
VAGGNNVVVCCSVIMGKAVVIGSLEYVGISVVVGGAVV